MIDRERFTIREHRRRDIRWLLVGISGLSALGWLINSQNPENPVALILFFLILFVTFFSLTQILTNIVRRSLLVGGGVVGFMLLRLIGLREPWYALLLVAALVSLELSFQKR